LKVEFAEFEEPLAIGGVRLAAGAAGIRNPGRDDLALVELSSDAQTAAVFTQNRFCAAPVIVARENITAHRPRLLILNSGNANAGTGVAGIADVRTIAAELARLAGCSEQEVLPFSTGVIGERLDYSKIVAILPSLVSGLASTRWRAAATAIMTTDTVAKIFSIEIRLEEISYRVTGMVKGSGMIHPNMATMLAFIATDADISLTHLRRILSGGVDRSFNRISIDGDTSTNDACVLTATGKVSNGTSLTPRHPHWQAVVEGIGRVFEYLAKSIVRDGEGATKFVEIIVASASQSDSLAVATTIAQSPLVKTALFAGDPNWGRILAAIGRAPVTALAVEDVSIWLNDYQIVKNGEAAAVYEESVAAAIMAETDIVLRVVLGEGGVVARIWTCDLTYEYIRINAEYRS
jgi:glutamate N-acetyltransferase / amino-acid N-acetyltransferase